jgi:LacI family transcriptional regulator
VQEVALVLQLSLDALALGEVFLGLLAELRLQRDDFLEELFRARGGLAGILVANSSGHLVGDWLAERGAKGECAVLSWDLVPANVRALREGKIDCVLSQRPAEQAREGLERLFRAVVRGEAASAPAPIPLEVYFKENIPVGGSSDEN